MNQEKLTVKLRLVVYLLIFLADFEQLVEMRNWSLALHRQARLEFSLEGFRMFLGHCWTSGFNPDGYD